MSGNCIPVHHWETDIDKNDFWSKVSGYLNALNACVCNSDLVAA